MQSFLTFAGLDPYEAYAVCSLSHWERVGVRGYGLSIERGPLTPTLSPSGRGSAPSSRHNNQIAIETYP